MPKKIDLLENADVMTDRAFRDLWQAAITAPDADTFAANADCPDADLLPVREQLRRLWHVANDSFRDLLTDLDMTQTALSVRFCIPFRTVQGWALNERTCPPYLRLMMAEAVGYIKLRS